MMLTKDVQFALHTDQLRQYMDSCVWGEFTISLQNGNILQSRMKQTFVTDVENNKLLTQQEAEIRAKNKREERQKEKTPYEYRRLNVVQKGGGEKT